jgi:hypothetical protein
MITEIFGENCLRAKVFDLLLSHPHLDYTKSEIAQCAGISRGSFENFIDKLTEYEIIIVTRKIGNSQLYKINLDSPITQALNSFQNQLADIEMEKEMREAQKLDPEIEPVKPFEEIAKMNSSPEIEQVDMTGAVGGYTPHDFRLLIFNERTKENNKIEEAIGSVHNASHEIIMSHRAVKELHNWLGACIKNHEEQMEKLKNKQEAV